VAVNYHTQENRAWEVCGQLQALGRRALAVGADVSRAEEVNRLVAAVEEGLGPVDILINNAGVLWQKPLEEITEEDFDTMIAVNLKSAFLMTQRVLPAMRQRKWGRIVNLSSIAAQTGGVTGPPYAASKAGMIGLTHSYARHLVKEGITVNTVAPALIETDMVTRNLEVTPELVPVGRFGAVAEVAQVIVMLAGNGYLTGQTINVNGGWYMC
jgi:3-oxoacyl-[acyl-carrier protein] reductase